MAPNLHVPPKLPFAGAPPLRAGLPSFRPYLSRLLLLVIPVVLAVGLTVLILTDIGGGKARPSGKAQPSGSSPGTAQVIPAGAGERDANRLRDLARIGAALGEYARQNGSYPSTDAKLQTLCTYEAIDAGCKLKRVLADLPADPNGKNNGYWYISDGASFTLMADW